VTFGNQVTNLPNSLLLDPELVILENTYLENVNKRNILNYLYYIRIGQIKSCKCDNTNK